MNPTPPRTPPFLRGPRHAARIAAEALHLAEHPSVVEGHLDEPRVSPDQVALAGTVVSTHGSASVRVQLDGTTLASVHVGPADETGTGRDHRTTTSWSAVVERSGLHGTEHDLEVEASFADGVREVVARRSLTVPAGRLVGAFDSPEEGASVPRSVLRASGWLRWTIGLDRVEVSVDGGPVVVARPLARPRADVAQLVDDVDAELSGWEAVLDLSGTEADSVVVSATAVGASERHDLGSVRVTLVPAGRPLDASQRERLSVLRARTGTMLAGSPRRDERRPGDPLCVVVAAHHLGLGGAQLWLDELLRAMAERHDVRFVVLSPVDGALREVLEERGAEVQITGPAPISALEYEQWLRGVSAVVALSGARSVLANTVGCFWAVDLASRLGLPAVWAVHESFSPEHYIDVGFPVRPDDAVLGVLADALRSADAVVFEAESTRDVFRGRVPDTSAVVVDYGIDLEAVDAHLASIDPADARRRLGVPEDATVLLCAGTWESRKGQAVLALAFDRVAAEFPDAVLALVGDNGSDYAAHLHGVVSALSSGDRILTVAATPDIATWYRAADAFTLASDIESLPRTMIEALAYGLPVVATGVFGVPDLVEDGVTGVLFEENSLDAATEGLRRYLSLGADGRRAMSDAASASVRPGRSSAGYADAVHRLLDGLSLDARAYVRRLAEGQRPE